MHIGIVENNSVFSDELSIDLRRFFPDAKLQAWHSAESLLNQPLHQLPEVLLLDVMLPGMTGIELTRKLYERDYQGKVVILTNMNSDELILQAIVNGAVGYVLKSEHKKLKEIIETVAHGGAILTPTIALRIMAKLRQQTHASADFGLSARLKQVLDLMVSGKTIPQVAKQLKLKPGTVHSYVKEIYKKLNVHNRLELANKVRNAS